ncbi:ABC transporter ATP-binding protein [Bradyrhizobium sp. 13971]
MIAASAGVLPLDGALVEPALSAPLSARAGVADRALVKRDSGEIQPVLALADISLSFGGVAALRDIDLEVAEGGIRAVIGPNGAGKSSLLNVISGLYRPDRGRVWLGEHSFGHVPTARLAQHGVARTFQNLAVFKGLSVRDNVLMGLAHRVRAGFLRQIAGSPLARRIEAENRAAAEDVIGFLHLREVRDRAAGTLPYGLQKRVELARALVARPSLLLLDEPFAGVTLGEKHELAAHVRNARNSYGATIVLIEHDIGVVMRLSDRIAVLDYGRKIADGTPDQVRSDQAVVDAYLGVAHADETELAL